jgi:hypothetical protein
VLSSAGLSRKKAAASPIYLPRMLLGDKIDNLKTVRDAAAAEHAAKRGHRSGRRFRTSRSSM